MATDDGPVAVNVRRQRVPAVGVGDAPGRPALRRREDDRGVRHRAVVEGDDAADGSGFEPLRVAAAACDEEYGEPRSACCPAVAAATLS
ncbi:MAG TPA: hypothetical protein PJ982_17025 [Lacipirellulaceae bacterium]|nr:hypothetical protein [Lacipirellulaceae bacterium]